MSTEIQKRLGLMTVGEAAEALSTSQAAILREVAMGRASYYSAGGKTLLDQSDILRMLHNGLPSMPPITDGWFAPQPGVPGLIELMNHLRERGSAGFTMPHRGRTYGFWSAVGFCRDEAFRLVQRERIDLSNRGTALEKFYNRSPEKFAAMTAKIGEAVRGKRFQVGGKKTTLGQVLPAHQWKTIIAEAF